MAATDSGVIIVRHGEGTHNTGDFYSGDPSQPGYIEAHLTQKGKQQVADTARQLLQEGVCSGSVIDMISSPLPRTVETRDILAATLSISTAQKSVDERLIEAAMGQREGQKLSAFNDQDSWFPENPVSFGAEPVDHIRQRVLSLFNECVNRHANQSGYIILVSHGAPLYLLLEAVSGDPEKLPTAGYRLLPLEAVHDLL